MGQRVLAPDGQVWVVRRRWLPWRPRWRGSPPRVLGHIFDFGDSLGCIGEIFGGLAVALAVILAVVVVVLFVVPALIALAEIGVLLVLVAVGAAGHVLFRTPWFVDAVGGSGVRPRVWKVEGWKKSGEVVTEIAADLRGGVDPHPHEAQEVS